MKNLVIAGNIGELLSADFQTGKLFWKSRTKSMFSDERSWASWNARYSGHEAMTYRDPNGYLCGRVFNKQVKAHRAIWAIAHGVFPSFIDHINGVRDDNRLANLRAVSVQENNRNMRVRSDSATGVTGVCWDSTRGKWLSTIGGAHIGRFDDFATAVAARASAQIAAGFHENHGRTK